MIRMKFDTVLKQFQLNMPILFLNDLFQTWYDAKHDETLHFDPSMNDIDVHSRSFEGLLGQSPVVDDRPVARVFDALPIKTGEFTMTESREAMKSTQGNKAIGLYGIPAEVWKLECFNDQLLKVCNRAYYGNIPDIWLKGAILPFPKKGDLGSASNYRGISLMAVGANIYSRMLLDRLRPHTDPKLRNNQNGIRKGRSAVAHILTSRRLVEGIKSKNLPSIITFADFHKVFDSIHMGKLVETVRAYGVPVEIVDAVNMPYTNTTVQILFPDGDTEFFEILAGVLQGDTLAPCLFITALDYATRQAVGNESNLGFTLDRSRSRRHPAKVNL